MEGITKAKLKELYDNQNEGLSDPFIRGKISVYEYLLDKECKELNPWKPITREQMNGDEYLVRGPDFIGIAFWDIDHWYSDDRGEVNPHEYQDIPES